jgi:sugar porter (SP) family MFS transporter
MEDTNSKKNIFFIFIAVIAAIAGILFGYDTGVVSGAILFINDEFNLSPQINGLVVSAVLFGALMGALLSGRLADQIGRKRLLLLDAIIFILGTLATAVGNTITLIIIGRIIVGVGIGIASYAAPLYISEISPAKYRGALVSLNQLAVTLGILLSYIVDYIFAPYSAWRWMFLAGIFPAALFFLGLLKLPDSPRFLAVKGQTQEALYILMRIHGNKKSAVKELSQIRKSANQQSNHWRILFSPFIRSTLVIGVGLAILQQVTGINTIIYYAPTIFKMAGFETASAAIFATMGIGIVFVLFTILALPLIDTLGRRPLLLIGLAGMGLSLFLLSFAFRYPAHSALLKWTAMSSMLLYIACFAFSLGPIMWLMIAEIYPLKVRGLGSSLATAANWGSNMFVALTFLTLIQLLGASATFFIYFLISIAGMLFIYYLVPETKHVSLERIEANLQAGMSFRKIGSNKLIEQIQKG